MQGHARGGMVLWLAAAFMATLAVACGNDGDAEVRGIVRSPVPTATPADPLAVVYPPTWMHSLPYGRGGQSMLISCLDADGDLRITPGETPYMAGADFEVPLRAGYSCDTPWENREHYQGTPSNGERYVCKDGVSAPVVIVAIGGGGTDLIRPYDGVSQGLMPIVTGIQQRAAEEGIATLPVLTSAAINGADVPQTRMEQWLALDLRRRLEAMPCLRAVLLGHSHGGVTVTSVTAALDGAYGGRMYGVLMDRTLALYDRPTHAFPARTAILNVFQTNEGWHGDYIDEPNVTNADRSADAAPLEPRERLLPLATVTHQTLDDSREVQAYIIDAVMAWVMAG